MGEAPKRRWFRFSLRTLLLALMISGPLLWLGRTAYLPYVSPTAPAWLELQLRGSLHMRQEQAERLGIKGPHDRMRELNKKNPIPDA